MWPPSNIAAFTSVRSPLVIDVPLTEPQQTFLVNLISQPDAIFDGVDDTLRTTSRPCITRQTQASDDRGCQHENPAVLLCCSRWVFHWVDGRRTKGIGNVTRSRPQK